MARPPRLLIVHALFKGSRDAKVIPMAVDTGATTTIIPPQIAMAIGCDPARARRRLAIITASGLEYLPVVCHNLPPQSTVEGLLGLDFLNVIPAFRRFQDDILRLIQG